MFLQRRYSFGHLYHPLTIVAHLYVYLRVQQLTLELHL
jgi:hypothetical protein